MLKIHFEQKLQEVTTNKVYVGIKFFPRERPIYRLRNESGFASTWPGMNLTLHQQWQCSHVPLEREISPISQSAYDDQYTKPRLITLPASPRERRCSTSELIGSKSLEMVQYETRTAEQNKDGKIMKRAFRCCS